ncbi:M20/M25/M40 family metallo-hydrolase [Spirosoma endophyticum]|uniref:Acetylornithine deacetylase/Succinyl-diaminopimelate desuccinylase n=1 Tax=Spirosoma endophyticum TaxID=662367 RepID=A0A1I1FWU4_9BACT|nr:M20/M25/M40 family metallo-hydrolase [Spirosoma endophyticum]SFC03502.1 Acetylornithine deacetylase/Succinyl-diaminopimelate desuccinylase [Spirosoma endophyticum]
MTFPSRVTLFLACIITLSANAQSPQQRVRQYRQTRETALMDEYRQFLTIPNVSSDSATIRQNAAFIMQMMKQRGIPASLLDGVKPGTNPAVFGEVKVPGATKTLIFYAHYDGQPVNPKQWAKGLQPFEPVFITAPVEQGGTIVTTYKSGDAINPTWRLSGRGSADDKAGVMAILNAYDALVKSNIKPTVNLKFFFEGEEELGSTHLGDILQKHQDKLTSDLWLIVDGPRHVSGKKVVQFGVRGDVNMNLTVYGPKRPLHSGNYGNWAPNPAQKLVNLLASMKNDEGRVMIKGFYDDVTPLTAREKQAMATVPNMEAALKKELGIAKPDGGGASFMDLMMIPTLNINGIQSANVGPMAGNVIPTKAEAVLDLRLVRGNDITRQIERVTEHIRGQGYHVLDHDPTDADRQQYPKLIKITTGAGYNAQRTPMDLPIAQEVIAAVQTTSTDPIVLTPTAGGSLPLYLFEKHLKANVVSVPIVNYDNNQHAENENVLVQYLWDGIETLAAIMQLK